MTQGVDLQDRFVRTQEHMAASLGDENVVLDMDSGTYYGMSGVGPRIWSLLEEPRTGEELVTRILEEYDADRDEVEADATRFLAELLDEGLVERTG